MTTATQTNPYAATYSQDSYQVQPSSRTYGGIRRLTFFGMSFLIGATFFIVTMSLGVYMSRAAESGQAVNTENIGLIYFASWAAYLAVWLYLCGQRLTNMGTSAWWALGTFVPIYGLFLSARCLVCPEGYDQHKQMDGPGKIILGLIVTGFVLALLLPFSLVFIASAAG